MATKLLIVETPGKADKIGAILHAMEPNQWRVQSSMGWPCEMLPHEVGSDRTLYKVRERGNLNLKKLYRYAKDADDVYFATDPTLEGEALAWHLQELLQLKNAKRIELHEITRAAINAAIPRPIDLERVKAFEEHLLTQKAKVRFELQKEIAEQLILAEIPERSGPNDKHLEYLYSISPKLADDGLTFKKLERLMSESPRTVSQPSPKPCRTILTFPRHPKVRSL